VLSSGFLEPALQPLGLLAAAGSRAARRPGAWGRVPLEGLEPLRAHFARALGAGHGAHEVLICPGGQAGLAAAFQGLAPRGAPVAMEDPTYLGAIVAARAAGLEPVPVPTDADGLRPDLLDAVLRRTGARLVYTQPTFANPTGATLAPDRRAAVLDLAERHGAFVVEDDWARDLPLDGAAPAPLAAHDPHGHVVHVRSMTKSAAPGLRIGAVVARGAAAARLKAVRLPQDLYVSGPLQETALELLAGPGFARHLRGTRRALRERRDALHAAAVERLPLPAPPPRPRGGLHLWLRLPDGVDDLRLAAEAARAGLVLSPGRPYFSADAPGPHLRLSFGGAPVAELLRGVDLLGELLEPPSLQYLRECT
jgi:DNA-binding transcriptional MocR family regulator